MGGSETEPGEFGLDAGVVLELFGSDSTPMVSLFLAEAGGGALFVRAGQGQPVYRTPSMPLPPLDPTRWFDNRSLVPLSSLQLARVVAAGPAVGADVDLSRPRGVLGGRFKDGTGRRIPAERVDDVLRRLGTLFPQDVIGPLEQEFERDSADLWIELSPTVGEPFWVGLKQDEAPDGSATARWIASRAGSGLAVSLSDRTVSGLIDALIRARESAAEGR